jgi:hypothetical protein
VVAKKKDWIGPAISKPGALRKTTGTPEGKNIPVDKLKELAKEPGKTGQRARLALTLRKMHNK